MSDARRASIEAAFADRGLLTDDAHRAAVLSVVEDLDRGRLRVATKDEAPASPGASAWTVHAWIQQAVVLYFAVAPMVEGAGYEGPQGSLPFHDKVPLKRGLAEAGLRVVPGGVVRYGSYCERGV
nr:2,3,4,5-tetrahydropyridine-2,6-dicarboxylate N-succinyltransferase [Planctomycetota bacterium]